MDNPKLQERLEMFSPDYQTLVIGDIPVITAETFGNSLGLNQHDKNVIENSFRLYLLALLSVSEWAEFIAEYTTLDLPTAELIVDEVQSNIADDIKLQLEEVRTEGFVADSTSSAAEVKGSAAPTVPEQTPSSTPEPVQKEPKPDTPFPQVRTMQSDTAAKNANAQTQDESSEATPTHTTAQADLLKKDDAATDVTPIPKNSPPSKPSTPQWESETSDKN